MYLIAGLGNPGRQYEHSRHNVGFEVIDRLAEKFDIRVNERKHRAICGSGMIEGKKVILVKPQTFMNLSGESIREAADYYRPQQIIVIYDDVSLEPGQLRIRAKGSAGGHNGVRSVIDRLGTQEFQRVKVGIGARPEKMDLADYVLGHFSGGEMEIMDRAFGQAAEAVAVMLSEGTDAAMNRFNAKKTDNAEGGVL